MSSKKLLHKRLSHAKQISAHLKSTLFNEWHIAITTNNLYMYTVRKQSAINGLANISTQKKKTKQAICISYKAYYCTADIQYFLEREKKLNKSF